MTTISTETVKSIEIGSTVETGTLRIHRYRDHLVLWDTTNAGKRGKKVSKASVSSLGDWAGRDAHQERLSQLLVTYTTFQSAISTLQDLLSAYPKSFSIECLEERGIDVTPAGFLPVVVRTAKLNIEAGLREFCIRDLEDKNNEPTAIPAIHGGKKSIPAFYSWLKANQKDVELMSFREVLDNMRALGIEFHSYCAMD